MTTPRVPAITLGFTTFRPETVPFAEKAVQGHDAIFLEEPDTPGFTEMLAGSLPVDEYILLTEFEFPEYAKETCRLLGRLHQAGVVIREVHPWMDTLVSIHEFFTSGGSPDQLVPGSVEHQVYTLERTWTDALLQFYTASRKQDFDALIETILTFARRDAEKIRDMDARRSEMLARETASFDAPYVECGSIHHSMVVELKRRLPGHRLQVRHLMEEVCRSRYGRRRILPPGDVLTYRYLLGSPEAPIQERTLAARAVVYNKLITKDEEPAAPHGFPHMENEAAVTGFVNTLSFEECRTRWQDFKNMSTREARARVLQEAH